MSPTTTTPPPIREEEETAASPSHSLPPQRTLVQVPPEQVLLITTAELKRRAARLQKSIERCGGVLQPIGLYPAGENIEGMRCYAPIWGRARALAAQTLGLPAIDALLYSRRPSARELAEWAEDEQLRSDDFSPRVWRLYCLLHGEDALSEDELTKKLGLSKQELTTPLLLARLPLPLVEAIRDGQCSQSLAKKIVRLSQGRQQELADLVESGGTPLSEDLVEGLWKEQASRVQQAAQLLPEQDVPAQNSRSAPQTGTPDGTWLTRAELVDLARRLAIVQQEVNTRLVPVFALAIQEVKRLASQREREEE